MARLRSISRNQRFRLACSAGAVFLLVAQFLRSGSLWWGALFAIGAAFLYFRETANMLSALPLFAGTVVLPFAFPHNLGTGVTTLFSAVIAVLFGAALGIKNLVLIHRDELREAAAYALSYFALLVFFMQASSPAFLAVWLFAMGMLWLSFSALAASCRYGLLLALLLGEIMLAVAWLPMGFLNATSLCFVAVLFTGDAIRENRISIRKGLVLALLGVFILATSHWRI